MGALSARGRRVRLAATGLVGALLLLGSFKGLDHDFPFAPFRMYATSGRATGAVRGAELAGEWRGRPVELHSEWLGIRRAELEGQYPRFRRDPRLLAGLARAFGERGVRLDRLRLVEFRKPVVNGRRTGPTTVAVIAEWRARP